MDLQKISFLQSHLQLVVKRRELLRQIQVVEGLLEKGMKSFQKVETKIAGHLFGPSDPEGVLPVLKKRLRVAPVDERQ